MKKGFAFTAIIISMFLLNVFSVSAITGSIGNARVVLYPEVNGWTTTTIDRTILVKNVNDVPLNITLLLGKDSDFLEVLDKEFILQPNEEKKAAFKVNVKKEGTYNGQINVLFRPLEGKESGVVLSSTIIVIAKKDQAEKEENSDTNIEDNSEDATENSGNSNEIEESKFNPVKFFGVSTLILLLILFVLLFLNSKRRNMKKNRGGINGRKAT